MKFTKSSIRSIIREEMQKMELKEQEEGSVSKTDVQKRLLDLKSSLDMPPAQYEAFLETLDEIIQLANQGRLKSKQSQIKKGLDRFDAK